MAVRVKNMFAKLRLELYRLVVDEDELGLKDRHLLRNSDCGIGPDGFETGNDCATGGGGGGGGDNDETVYHGTSEAHFGSIMKEGLQPGKGRGADDLALTEGAGNYATTFREPGRKTSVYVSSSPEEASRYAAKTAKFTKSRPLVIEVKVPRGSLKSDEAGGKETSKRFEGSIETSRIKAIHDIDYDNDRLVRRPTINADAWRFNSDPEKLQKFQEWLRRQLQQFLVGRTQEELWRVYTEQGIRKGAARSFEDARGIEKLKDAGVQLAFYAGTKEEFLRSSFRQPEAVSKIQLLASRTFTDLKNVTEDMATRMSRTLVDGLTAGQGPRQIAVKLDADLDIGRTRALTIARTEIIRAHAEGQLLALEQLGVQEVGAMVEWSTAGDERVCPLCNPLEGVVLKIDEAKGMLPRHPNCRCAWIPANVGEDQRASKTTKGQITKSVTKSQELEGKTSWGPGQVIAKKRPESILNTAARFDMALNNCGIGPGGFEPGNDCAVSGGSFSEDHDDTTYEVRLDSPEGRAKLRVKKYSGKWTATDISVDEGLRRKGVATTLFKKAISKVGPIKSSGVESSAGKKLVESLKSKGLITDNNCGIGAEGFEAGNDCAGGGSGGGVGGGTGNTPSVVRVEGKNNYHKFEIHSGGKKVGYLTTRAWPGQKELTVKQIHIDEQHRRKGLASTLHEEAFKFAKTKGLSYKSDSSQMRTPPAEAYWKKMVSKGRAKLEGGVYTMVDPQE
jgi:SPP1 gp7 family putative phage head morphogenesis protein